MGSSIALSFQNLSTEAGSRKTYIVQTRRSGMPAMFVSPEHWYTSTLASIRKEATITNQNGPGEVHHSTQDDDSIDLVYTYQFASHGFAARLTEQEATSIAKVPGFLSVVPDKLFKLQTTYTPEFMGLTPHSGLWPRASLGKDVIVGLLDTGIWPESKSFNDAGMGPIPERWKGGCVDGFDFESSLCNRKLIGAKYFLSALERPEQDPQPSDMLVEYRSPRDVQGHGTHTASTTAGVHVANASFFDYANGTAKGVAPSARIAAYKVCWESLGGCLGADLLAGMDEAISDGVDVISVSLGGSSMPLYEDPLAIGAFGALSYDILVSCAAGNTGPSPSSILNNAPWLLTVAASTVDRNFPATVQLGNGDTYDGQSLYTGESPELEQLPLISMGLCEEGSLDTQNVAGKIVICQQSRQERQRSAAAVVAAAGGAAEIIVQQSQTGHSILSSGFLLPSVNVYANDGAAIQKYAAGSRNRRPTAAISMNGTQFRKQRAPAVASFSSRGPNSLVPSILKPDVTAPGVSILAAWGAVPPTPDPLDNRKTPFNIISGTSMACPHVTGLVALLRAAHPHWSGAAIKSALMTTARNFDTLGTPILDDYNGKLATPLDYGAGHVDPNAALDPGLVYDISVQDYVDLLCSLGFAEQELLLFTRGDFDCGDNYQSRLQKGSNLNYPALVAVFEETSFEETSKRKESTLRRQATNVGAASSVYKVEVEEPEGVKVKVVPTELTFSREGEKQSFEVVISDIRNTSMDMQMFTSTSYTFGSITWVDSQKLHKVRSPIMVTWS
ncbi:hypothetical protein L7F22_069275 [Adiantum nelumboides]|nr:hypothetical protein [Adiantum nelumboides]